MNNRQAALLVAASSVTDTPWGKSITKGVLAARIVENSRIYELWLNEQDLAEEEGRLPASLDFIQSVAERGYGRFEKEYHSQVHSFHQSEDGRTVVAFANGIQVQLADGSPGSQHELLKKPRTIHGDVD